ncbi:putative ABC transport system permease protein [Streptomyces sp. SceaMP-e96]|uniref:ABC transporter permease n=1 Tax=Streptomyces TaxID=1883 RepID=UPI000823CCCF|nr:MULTISPECIES: ABC transporter permease [unclassified Streptomyces]MYT18525.1 FtsX-like permease family protein [Streptomyces sp. SID4951]SCK57239.1 putative ABC transport system permease protein [Streptomyces sp. SceaMP-e96]
MRRSRLSPSSLGPRDVLYVGSAGLRTRPMRVVLSALGIAIGIATMIAVVGISASSKAQLLQKLDALGTNMLVASPGQGMFSEKVKLPKDSPGMVRRIDGVQQVGATGDLSPSVRRSEKIPEEESGGITVKAAGERLLSTLRGSMASGSWLNAANGRYPSVVLGHVSAERLGITEPGQQVYIGGRYFTVVGILDPLPLAPEIERSALVGWSAAGKLLGFDGHPTSIYERSTHASVRGVRDLIPHTVDPQNPQDVQVTDPSSALQAKAATEGAFSELLLGLGGVALLVGGIGVANTMIISVLERRHEIGLRRSMGATRGQIRLQFVTESLLLSGLGGIAGIVLGAAATYAFAASGAMPWVVPPWTVGGGFGATLVIGTLAGLYPAVRAARLSPTLALQAV